MSRRAAALAVAALAVAAGAALACGGAELVVGDDTAIDAALPDAAVPLPDSGGFDADPPLDDAGVDGPQGVCTAAVGSCVADEAVCLELAPGAPSCPNPADFCCAFPCPALSPPGPSFCDGGPYAARYSPTGCIVGYACAPVDCAVAGGTCVGPSPGDCPSGKYGDAAAYSCGGGLACCLP
jgi:hypothetical protein